MSRSGAEGQRVARHERCYQRRQQILDLEHYLEPLSRKPGALAGSTALAQWRQQQRWKDSHDRLWQALNARHGRQNGTRLMVEVIGLGYERLENTIQRTLTLGCSDGEAIRYLLLESRLAGAAPEALQLPEPDGIRPAASRLQRLRSPAEHEGAGVSAADRTLRESRFDSAAACCGCRP